MPKKLILFDIDGTLILSGGVVARLMAESVSEELSVPISWNILDFVGNTDRGIIHTLLRRSGVSESILEEMTDQILAIYLKRLKITLKKNDVIQVLPGVKKLLARLHDDEQFALGLVTGNIIEGAQLKLSVDHLFDYFPIGAFGDDDLNREQLPPIAIQRAEKYYQHFFERSDIWIVGDSANDIRCAQINHLKSLAVASGHIKREILETSRPTAILSNLSDSKKVISILLSL
jgi:phosphoglycolate phosphatase